MSVSHAAGDHAFELPEQILKVVAGSVTAEFATLTRKLTPITTPATPYLGATGTTLEVSTGLTYPAKAERARRDPRVCLLFADPIGSPVPDPSVVVVQGLATVKDSDLQANTDRYVALSMEKLPAATKGVPKLVLARMAWYFARIWIEITPIRILYWQDRDLGAAPQEWTAPDTVSVPPSDPEPPGHQPRPWLAQPSHWEQLAQDAMQRMALADITVVDESGFPLCLPVTVRPSSDQGSPLSQRSGGQTSLMVRIELGRGAPTVGEGAACLTFHSHPEVFTGQENLTLIGRTVSIGDILHLQVERALAGWSLPGNALTRALGFLGKGLKLAPRLRAEARRRGQEIPKVRL